MFVPNSHLLVEEAREHRAHLLREADRFKCQRLVQPRSRRRPRRLRQQLGGWMIALGSRLVDERSQQPLPSA